MKNFNEKEVEARRLNVKDEMETLKRLQSPYIVKGFGKIVHEPDQVQSRIHCDRSESRGSLHRNSV